MDADQLAFAMTGGVLGDGSLKETPRIQSATAGDDTCDALSAAGSSDSPPRDSPLSDCVADASIKEAADMASMALPPTTAELEAAAVEAMAAANPTLKREKAL